MRASWTSDDLRRVAPRIDVEALCWECSDTGETSGLVVDLSSTGARLERPYLGGRSPRAIPLQLEVPEIDEVMWASGEVCFDQLMPAPTPSLGGPFGLIRRTGYRIVVAAARDLRMLRDYVFETHRLRERLASAERELLFASCYK
jgi:hypothetical protein